MTFGLFYTYISLAKALAPFSVKTLKDENKILVLF